jgi:hypothetical protein
MKFGSGGQVFVHNWPTGTCMIPTSVIYFFANNVRKAEYWTPLLYQRFFYSPTDAQVNCLKNNFKIYIKIDTNTAPICFGAITIIRERVIRAC